jgi:membrane-bound metal-dependent hydrolase YbcI (DUF457 family)
MGGLAAFVYGRRYTRQESFVFFLIVWLAAVLPDIDYYPILWGDLSLANHNHQWFTHSILFSLLSSVVLAIVGKWLLRGTITAKRLFIPILIAALSHLVFDYLTYDGRYPIGIPLLWPLEARFNSPISIFGGVSKGSFSQIFSIHNLLVILRELLVGGFLVILVWFFSRRKKTGNQVT